ncbi:VOC family protein [Leisingera sp. F5]|uniref:bleomycin resistance protein n=1 Tax=Leisingera sp. F5 TaxID=1813816 RepID=UPI000AA1E89F|nr:VOC family protein [Leisingera sp. F5]
MKLQRAMPILQVRDVTGSVAFYQRLGFTAQGLWGDPPGFGIVQRGQVTLGLDRSESGEIPVNQGWAAYLYVEDADALHAEFTALNLPHLSLPEDREYGCRDFQIKDPDGHGLAFGQDLSSDAYGPGLGPDSE